MIYRFLSIIIGLLLFFYLLRIGSNMSITKKNLELIEDIIPKLDNKLQSRINEIINWHMKYNHVIFTERSIKYYFDDRKYNKDRFTIVVPLSYFYKSQIGTIDRKKWIEWANILELPKDIEFKCINYIVIGRGDVDLIWGLDLGNNENIDAKQSIRQKVYLEDAEKRIIEGYIYDEKNVLQNYTYHRKTCLDHSKFRYIYLRKDEQLNKMDSCHFVLKNPIKVSSKTLGTNKNYYIYILSFEKGKSQTFYYRTS